MLSTAPQASSHRRSECPLHTFGEFKIHNVFAGNCRSVAKYRYLHPAKLQQQRLPAIILSRFNLVSGIWRAQMAKSFLLNTGAAIPSVGLGTWQISPAVVEDAIRAALQVLPLLAYV